MTFAQPAPGLPWRSRFFFSPAILAFFCLFLWYAHTNAHAKTVSGSAEKNTAVSTTPVLIDKLLAKIVYQRPDGIYAIQTGENSPQRLINYGTNPRWSPDGKLIAFIHGNAIMLYTVKSSKIRQLAVADQPKALCFYPDGKSVIFTNNKALSRITLKGGKVTTLLKGGKFYEVDIAEDGNRVAATVRTLTGFKVQTFDLKNGSDRTVSQGCSASISPDGSMVTVNGKNHRFLDLYSWDTLKKVARLSAPADSKFDNQHWSNSLQWLVSTSEGKRNDIFLHHLDSDTSYQVTTSGDCDRGDLYVNKILP